MFFRIFLFIIGFLFLVLGNFYLIVYINLFSLGYTIVEYFSYVFSRYECYYVFIGILLIIISVYKRGE